MQKEIFVKNVNLSVLNKATIKSTWNNNEDRLELEIFVRETLDVYIGSCDQESLRKKKEINIDFNTIKDALTSASVQENVSYELNVKKLKFSVIAQEIGDSDASFGEIIYLKIDVKKVEPENVLKLTLSLLDEMFEIQQQVMALKTDLNRFKEDLKEASQRYQKMNDLKTEYEKSVHHKFLEIINSKKQRISELEKKLEGSKRDSNKFINLSSDFDQSDLSVKEATPAIRKTPSKPVHISSSSDDAGPSKSTYHSPARSKSSSKTNTPRSSKPHPPSRSSRLSSRTLFDFKKRDDSDDDSTVDELVKSPTTSKRRAKVKSPCQREDNTFTDFSIKVTQKVNDDDSNRSSAELFIPKLMKRISSSPENRSKSGTPNCFELAQKMECDIDIVKITEGSSDDGKTHQKAIDDGVLTQQIELPELLSDDDEVVENSQPTPESPSIFDSFSKRKQNSTPRSSKRIKFAATKKSNYSVDTIDILG